MTENEEYKKPSKFQQAKEVIKLAREMLSQDFDLFYSSMEQNYRHPRLMIMVAIMNVVFSAMGVHTIFFGGNVLLGFGYMILAYVPNIIIYVMLKLFRSFMYKHFIRKKTTPYYAVA